MALIEIVASGEGWLAVNKPAGLSVHQSSYVGRPETTLVDALRRQLGVARVHAVHRLDHATSGVMLMALDPRLAAYFTEQFATRNVEKRYLAIARGHTEAVFVVDAPIAARDGRSPKPARTAFATLAQMTLPYPVGRYPEARYSLIEARPDTGRHHQIRRHLKHAAHPVVGDVKYGKGEHNRLFRRLGIHRLLLHAAELTLVFPDGERRALRAPLDEAMRRACEFFGAAL
jgi:tRNA pseudouridine65 synthase